MIGPGLGRTPEAAGRVTRLVRLDKPMVLDADALNILSDMKRWPTFFKAQAVLTPHPGEMARLGKLIGRGKVPADDEGRIDYAVAAAAAFGQVVVLKGGRTVVTDARRVYLNHTGDSSLSKAGTGDVLSGILGCLLGQKRRPGPLRRRLPGRLPARPGGGNGGREARHALGAGARRDRRPAGGRW